MSSDINTNSVARAAADLSIAKKSSVPEAAQNRQTPELEEGIESPPLAGEAQKVDSEELQKAVSQLNDRLQQVQRNLSFSVDESSGQTIVRVVDTLTKEVVRQIPNEVVLRVSRNIQDQLDDVSGLIFESIA